MPHVSNDVSPDDELKVFQVEEENESSAENLKEVKNSLIEVTEEEEKRSKGEPNFEASKSSSLPRPDHHGKHYEYLSSSPFGYVVSPYPHPNAPYGALPMVNRVPLVPPNHSTSPIAIMMYNTEPFQPPPAHMGHIDSKTGIARPSVYSLPAPSQFHSPIFSHEFAQQFPWHPSTMYSMASGFRSPPYHHPPVSLSPANHLQGKFHSSGLLHSHHPSTHHSVLTPKIEESQDSRYLCNFSSRQFANFNHHHHSPSSHHLPQALSSSNSVEGDIPQRSRNEKKKSHIKKPLNAFMLFMKEQRPHVVAECTLKESAAINQILGKKWHNLSREQQQKYYEMARTERQMHMQRYPGWTARDNYAINAKKKKRKRDKSQDGDGNNPKKCRARFGLDQQSSWCKPCRRKKKCIRYRSGSDNTAGESEDNMGSVGSLEAPTPDSRYSMDVNNLSDSDSGNGDIDDDELESSEFSLSSPPVPRLGERVQSFSENGGLPAGSPPSLHTHHPLNVQKLSRPSGQTDTCDGEPTHLLQLPTPPSTDSSAASLLAVS